MRPIVAFLVEAARILRGGSGRCRMLSWEKTTNPPRD
jgi:hypothetical protein